MGSYSEQLGSESGVQSLGNKVSLEEWGRGLTRGPGRKDRLRGVHHLGTGVSQVGVTTLREPCISEKLTWRLLGTGEF